MLLCRYWGKPRLIMSEEFYRLISNDDVLLFEADTFTGGKFKELIKKEFSSRLL